MMLNQFLQIFLPVIEAELVAAVNRADGDRLADLHNILAYHMGWEGEGAGLEARGKRIRPMLTLLVTAAAGGEWRSALPAACAIELIHNFSLIHDDIEDNSPQRRGRLSIWNRWGIAQATNAGDAMFTLAHLELLHLIDFLPTSKVLQAVNLLQQTCLHLTQGQYLDISFEDRQDLTEADYWEMISGKTGGLMAACTELGALAASAQEIICQAYQLFGRSLGLAFQVQDDLLGIWGDNQLTGKSAESDLITGKKTLPILFGINQRGKFYNRWLRGPISPDEALEVTHLLEIDGGRFYAQEQVDQLTNQALEALELAQPIGDAGVALHELAEQLLHRQA